jgi:hypothetical protein
MFILLNLKLSCSVDGVSLFIFTQGANSVDSSALKVISSSYPAKKSHSYWGTILNSQIHNNKKNEISDLLENGWN